MMLVELAIGDAYGAGLEYAPADMVRERNTTPRPASRARRLPRGRSTTATTASALPRKSLAGSTSQRQLLTACIAYTGDVDTVATIAMAAACADDITPDLPRHLYETLENGAYGRDHLAALDHALFAAYPGAGSSVA